MVWVYDQVHDVWLQRGRNSITGTKGLPAPTANFTYTTSGLTTNFNGSSSSQTNGTITAYAWDFGDGSNGTGATPSHAYTAAGTYTASLTVTGTSGLQAVTSKPITVSVPVNVPPNAVFSYTQGTGTDSLRLNVDATASNDNDGTIVKYHWDFGNGQTYDTTNKTANGFYYTAGGTYTVVLTVTDDDGATGQTSKTVTVTATNAVPTVSVISTFLATDKKTFSINWDAKDSDGYISDVAVNWGDSTALSHFAGTSSTAPANAASHVYAASGPFTVTITATDNSGATASTTATANPVVSSGGTTGPVYTIGTPTDNIPSSVRVYTFADLGLTAATTNLQTVVDKLPGVGLIQLPNGYQGVIPNFNHHGQNYGIYNANFIGLIGGLSNGQLTAKISMAANAMTQAQLNTYPGRTRNSGNTTVTAIHTGNQLTHYFAGIEFDGADQQTVTDGNKQETGPATWAGMSLNNVGANSILQNCYFRGFGHANDTTPPGEVGAWNETHSTGLIFRRLEHDGRLPGSTTRRSGGIQWNASGNSLLEDVYTHDAYYSGLTYSFTSTPSSTSSESHDYTTRRVQVEHNSNHGNKNDNFAAINMEFNWGTIHHYQPHLSRDTYGGSESHIRQWVYSSSLGTQDKNTNIIVHQPKWDNSNANDNGCFSIVQAGYTAGGGGFKAPTVYLTADETKPATAYISTGGAVPSNVTPANNYYVLKHG